MCELGVFPIVFENDLLKVDKILGLTFFNFNFLIFNLKYLATIHLDFKE